MVTSTLSAAPGSPTPFFLYGVIPTVPSFVSVLPNNSGETSLTAVVDSEATVHIILMPAHIIYFIGTFLFVTGMLGVFFHNRTFIMVLVKAEMMYLGINLLFVASSFYFMEMAGFVYGLILFGVVAAESVIGLALFFFLLLTDRETVLYDLSDVVDEWR